jgi:hypothetical protein
MSKTGKVIPHKQEHTDEVLKKGSKINPIKTSAFV